MCWQRVVGYNTYHILSCVVPRLIVHRRRTETDHSAVRVRYVITCASTVAEVNERRGGEISVGRDGCASDDRARISRAARIKIVFCIVSRGGYTHTCI